MIGMYCPGIQNFLAHRSTSFNVRPARASAG
jgi:hypothetical protein